MAECTRANFWKNEFCWNWQKLTLFKTEQQRCLIKFRYGQTWLYYLIIKSLSKKRTSSLKYLGIDFIYTNGYKFSFPKYYFSIPSTDMTWQINSTFFFTYGRFHFACLVRLNEAIQIFSKHRYYVEGYWCNFRHVCEFFLCHFQIPIP